MSIEIERFDPSSAAPPWIRHEHLARFRFGASFVKDRIVVDCACGTGEGTRMFAELGASHVHAFDVSPDAVLATAMRCQALNVTASIGDAQALPLPDASADVFISFETFEHLIDPESLLSEAHRILKHGGTFICSSPNRDVSSPGNSLQSKPWNRFHTREYSQAEFLVAVERHFTLRKMLGQNPVGVRRAKLMRHLGHLSSVMLPVRLNQILKLPRFLYGDPGRHVVQAWDSGFEYEYCVVVCTKG